MRFHHKNLFITLKILMTNYYQDRLDLYSLKVE